MHQNNSSVREEQTGSYEIDPEIRAKARELLGLGATVQNASPQRMTLEDSMDHPRDTSEGRLFNFLRSSSRENIGYALGLFSEEIHMQNEEEAKTQLTNRLDKLEKIGYPVGDYKGLDSFKLYAHFVELRSQLRARYQHRR